MKERKWLGDSLVAAVAALGLGRNPGGSNPAASTGCFHASMDLLPFSCHYPPGSG